MAMVGVLYGIRLEHNIDNLSSARGSCLVYLVAGLLDADIAVEASETGEKYHCVQCCRFRMVANANNNKQMLLRLLS